MSIAMLFFVFSICVFNLIAYFIPKHLTRIEIYSSSLFALVVAIVTDKFLDLKYDLYGYFEPGLEIKTLIAAIGIYPAINVIFLNYYPHRGSIFEKTIYILGWVLFSVAYEWLSVESGYFYYHGWKLWYSAICYPFIFFILACNLSLIRKLTASEIQPPESS